MRIEVERDLPARSTRVENISRLGGLRQEDALPNQIIPTINQTS